MSKGKILLVGLGPSAGKYMTLRAREAIGEADVIIGYSTYLKLIQDLLDGKEIIRKGMRQELDRCNEACEQARQGKVVALISSGDIGIYGMASPTYEVLLQSGWTPDSGFEVEVIPGSTALSTCAALVGAPLGHDFCAISLSDLLTPWPVIVRRLEAAAHGDFVIALYNPKSGHRTHQIVDARDILLRYRESDTPVAIVRAAYRRQQDIRITTLNEMLEHKIGMLSTVLVGNSSTYLEKGLMITPRGYGDKYRTTTTAGLDKFQAKVADSGCHS
uniref:Precorrin-3B C17-methyltransferase n=1 Tax=Candidatus Kentrum sp. LFY TaxID=2126342 RepID=A0A450UIH6_9GAMM|nr:MAG: precorrin-3B C17-methyltransferase [Candidatus Kentron sp. LFY]